MLSLLNLVAWRILQFLKIKFSIGKGLSENKGRVEWLRIERVDVQKNVGLLH